MPQYSTAGNNTLSTSYKTLAFVVATTTGGNLLRRGRLYDFTVGPSGSPNSTDCGCQYDVTRVTASGSYAATAIVPTPTDSADVAFNGGAYYLCTTDPTFASSSSLWNTGVNQRAAVRWVASGPDAEFVYPATAFNGIGL